MLRGKPFQMMRHEQPKFENPGLQKKFEYIQLWIKFIDELGMMEHENDSYWVNKYWFEPS